MKRVILLSFIFAGIVAPTLASIPSTAYVQQQIANQIATAVANKADRTDLENIQSELTSLSANVKNFSIEIPDNTEYLKALGLGYTNTTYVQSLKDFLNLKVWNDFQRVFSGDLIEPNLFPNIPLIVYRMVNGGIYTGVGNYKGLIQLTNDYDNLVLKLGNVPDDKNLLDMIESTKSIAISADVKADTNATAVSSKVDTAASANQTMAGSYTVSGTLNLTGVATVETPPLPSAE